ncbi:MAG: DUF2007 domain-containing protein [Oscillospiraceae bacterium]|nr:DUF2007 domain-containing protein [Oscillospiraceae bacterium]
MSEQNKNIALLANVADGIDAPMIIELLKNEGIECWCTDSSSGSFLRNAIGFSPSGRQLYVPADRLEDARGILEAYFSDSVSGNLPPYDPEMLEGQDPPPSKQSFITLYIAIAAAALVLFLLKTTLH